MRAVFTTIIVALLLGGGGTFLWLYFGGLEGEQSQAIAFIDVYGDYAEIADTVEAMVYLPGTEGNVNRAELLSLLNTILTEEMESARRDSLARLAFSNLDVIKREIDTAQSTQAKLYEALQVFDATSKVFRSIDLRNRAGEIVKIARKRAEISSHITSVLSETNEHTHSIITQILADEGELTATHVRSINETTARAEERFDSLSVLYKELLAEKEKIEIAFADFVASAI